MVAVVIEDGLEYFKWICKAIGRRNHKDKLKMERSIDEMHGRKPKHDTFPDQETAFPCPLTRAGYCQMAGLLPTAGPDGKKVNILHDCWERCHASDYFYGDDGLPVAYCSADFMGERELISGKITRDN